MSDESTREGLSGPYGFGEFRLDPALRELSRDGETIPLSPKAYEILLQLVSRAGRAVSRQELMDAVWPDTVVEPGNLDQHVSALRRALGSGEYREAYIATVRGFGFRFAVPVTRATPSGTQRAVASAEEPSPRTSEVTEMPLRHSRLRKPAVWISAAALLLLVPVSLVVGVSREAPGPAGPSVAVLGFRDLSGRAESAWLSVALTELLGADLVAGDGLTRVPGETVARAKVALGLKTAESLSKESLHALGELVSADYVAVGSYFAAREARADTLRFDVVVQEARSGRTVASVTTFGSEAEIATLASRAGAEIRAKLGLAGLADAAGEETEAEFPLDREAGRLYAEGLEKLRTFEPRVATELFEKALERSPNVAAIHEAASDAWSLLGHDAKARAAAERALMLSDRRRPLARQRAEARLAARSGAWGRAAGLYAAVFEKTRSVDDGLRLFDARYENREADEAAAAIASLRALPLPAGNDPRLDVAEGWLARLRSDFGGMEAAGRRAAERGRALRADLLVADALRLVSWAALSLDRNDEAMSAAEEARRLAAAAGDARLTIGLLSLLGNARYSEGDLDGATAAFEEAIRLADATGYGARNSLLTGLARIHAARGELAQARQLQETVVASCRDNNQVESLASGLWIVAENLLAEGDLAGAGQRLEESVRLARASLPPARLGTILLGQAEWRRLAGDLPGARAALEEAVRLLASAKISRALLARVELARVRLQAGDTAGALAEAEAVRAEAERAGSGASWNEIARYARGVAAEALVALGRGAEARETLAPVSNLAATSVAGIPRASLVAAKARALAASGGRDEARRLLEGSLAGWERHGNLAAAFEIRLALGELVPGATRSAHERAALRSLADEAKKRGYALVASRAARSLAPASS